MANSTAITTHYNGYKFRSRLEARWAIFFDELQIPYAYEPEGFDLSGVWYLPDFHLTNGLVLHKLEVTQRSKIYVEIKATPDLDDDDRQKVAEFVRQLDYHILLIGGQPDVNAPIRLIDHHPDTGWNVVEVRWLEMPDGQIGLVPVDHLNDVELLNRTHTGRLRHALDKARQARFEHGETPSAPAAASENDKHSKGQKTWRAETKTCEHCGEAFRPYRPHYTHCLSCYHKHKKPADARNEKQAKRERVTVQKTAVSPRSKPTAHKARKAKSAAHKRNNKLLYYGIGFTILLFLSIVVVWFTIYLTNNPMFSAPAEPTPAVTAPALVLPSTNTPAPTATNSPTATPVPTETAAPTAVNAAACSCTDNLYDCTDFDTQVEAQACYDACLPVAGDIHFLDGDQDGQACTALP